MSGPTIALSGPRVRLVPAALAVAVAVTTDGDLAGALATLGLSIGAGWPHTDTADALRPLAEHYHVLGEGGPDPTEAACWLVTVAGVVVGECGWRPAGPAELELGYGLAPTARGRGLGAEAVGVLAAWAEQQRGIRVLSAEVLVGNQASRALLERLGFVADGSHADHLRLVRAC